LGFLSADRLAHRFQATPGHLDLDSRTVSSEYCLPKKKAVSQAPGCTDSLISVSAVQAGRRGNKMKRFVPQSGIAVDTSWRFASVCVCG